MSRKVYKYQLTTENSEVQTIKTHKGAKFLKADLQDENPVCWFEVDTDFFPEERSFVFYQTGETIYPYILQKYIDTLLFEGGNYVLHLYEVLQK